VSEAERVAHRLNAEADHPALLARPRRQRRHSYQAPTCPPGSTPVIAAYAGPSTLMVDSPWPARTTTMSAGSAEGLLSRCTAPLGT
jgi:hypothetical protein